MTVRVLATEVSDGNGAMIRAVSVYVSLTVTVVVAKINAGLVGDARVVEGRSGPASAILPDSM
jgi:hypothetical protein